MKWFKVKLCEMIEAVGMITLDYLVTLAMSLRALEGGDDSGMIAFGARTWGRIRELVH